MSRGGLQICLHSYAAAGLRLAQERDHILHRSRDSNVCDAQSRLVCARRELRHLSIMAEFTVNPKRFDPYKNFKFRIKWDGRYVAGISRISGLRRTTEVIQHREGGDPSSRRKSPGLTEFAPITLENEGWERDQTVKEPVEPSTKK